jgi:hypothetical protein
MLREIESKTSKRTQMNERKLSQAVANMLEKADLNKIEALDRDDFYCYYKRINGT